MSDSDWSIVEGDEYQISISDRRPKFELYSPTHLILTSVSWDHADLYPTREAYFDEFRKLVERIPSNGMIVASADDKGVAEVLSKAKLKTNKIIYYGASAKSAYRFHSIVHTKNGLTVSIDNKGRTCEVSSPMLGRYNAENIAACFAIANEIGIPFGTIIDSIAGFKGIKRRFEKRLDGEITVLDCHAPTADKATSVLESIRDVYKGKIISVYEPNIGGRQQSSAHMYDGAFKDADAIVIPRLTKTKVSEDGSDMPLEADGLAKTISKTHQGAIAIEDDTRLVEYLVQNAKKGDVIAFLGSHGFRGMIEETVRKLS